MPFSGAAGPNRGIPGRWRRWVPRLAAIGSRASGALSRWSARSARGPAGSAAHQRSASSARRTSAASAIPPASHSGVEPDTSAHAPERLERGLNPDQVPAGLPALHDQRVGARRQRPPGLRGSPHRVDDQRAGALQLPGHAGAPSSVQHGHLGARGAPVLHVCARGEGDQQVHGDRRAARELPGAQQLAPQGSGGQDADRAQPAARRDRPRQPAGCDPTAHPCLDDRVPQPHLLDERHGATLRHRGSDRGRRALRGAGRRHPDTGQGFRGSKTLFPVPFHRPPRQALLARACK